MKISTLIIVGAVFIYFSFIPAAIFTPPDVVSQLVMVFEMAIVYGILAFIISRFKSLKQTPGSVNKLIIAFVCLLSITIPLSLHYITLGLRLTDFLF